MTAAEVIAQLGLAAHPEGGWFRETWRAESAEGERAAGTAIYFLLDAHEQSAWHRVDAAEAWHHYAGASLKLVIDDGQQRTEHRLGKDLAAGELPQAVVPPHAWQRAEPLPAAPGEPGWVLVGCTVSPGFEFSGFELSGPPERDE